MQAVGFEAEDPSDRRRLAFASNLLIGGASFVFQGLSRLGSRGAIHRTERYWARVVSRFLRIDMDITGAEYVDTRHQYVVLSLHEGFADVLALMCLPLPLRFLARGELFGWPVLGRYLEATGQVRVDERPSRSSLRQLYRRVGEVFDSGDSLVVFPQGSILGVEVGFQAGAFRIARRLGYPILPVVVTGSHRVWEHPYSPTVRFDQRISMCVLPPIPSDQMDPAGFRVLERRMKAIALDPAQSPARRFVPERDGWWDGYRYEVDADFPVLRNRLARRRAGFREGQEEEAPHR